MHMILKQNIFCKVRNYGRVFFMHKTSDTPYHNSDGDKYSFKKKTKKVYVNIVDGIKYDGKSDTDPLGMYTGVPADEYDTPVQDADDL